MNPAQQVREFVRSVAKKLKFEQKQQLKEEIKLRKYIRKLLREVEEASPHDSTGINVLEDLLKTIIPILESQYKRLTSDVQQRKSFRAHIISSVQNLIATKAVYFTADKQRKEKMNASKQPVQPTAPEKPEGEMNELADATPKDPAFIDINKEKKQKQAKEENPQQQDAFVDIEGEDPTGRGFALQAFNKIKKQILESYSLLGKEEDREVFYDYLLTNLKLYFDMFEVELQKTQVQEPTTDAYEQEKQKIDASMKPTGSEPAAAEAPAGIEAQPGLEGEQEI